jgi:transporter family-2 protein
MMHYILSLLAGVLASVIVLANGQLAEQTGAYSSVVFNHITGLILIAVIVLIKRERPFAKRQSWFLYLGGAIGVGTVVFTNFAFSRISVSEILALSLLGQSITGLCIDQVGWMGMPRHPFHKRKIAGLLFILGGIAVMTRRIEVAAVILAFTAGVNIVVSRTLNARLAELSSVRISTFFNYVVGFAVSAPVFLLLGRDEAVLQSIRNIAVSSDLYMYLGGVIGVCIILICNIVVVKIAAFYLSLLLFIGQVFTGIIIDALISGGFSLQILAGGVLVTAGLCADLLLDRKKTG